MSRFREYLLHTETNDFGDFILNEGVSRNQILDILEMLMGLEKRLPEVISGVTTNQKWKNYLENFHHTLSVVGDLLLRIK